MLFKTQNPRTTLSFTWKKSNKYNKMYVYKYDKKTIFQNIYPYVFRPPKLQICWYLLQ